MSDTVQVCFDAGTILDLRVIKNLAYFPYLGPRKDVIYKLYLENGLRVECVGSHTLPVVMSGNNVVMVEARYIKTGSILRLEAHDLLSSGDIIWAREARAAWDREDSWDSSPYDFCSAVADLIITEGSYD